MISGQFKNCSDINDVSATMIYTHVLNQGGRGVRSPFDRLTITPPPGRVYQDFADLDMTVCAVLWSLDKGLETEEKSVRSMKFKKRRSQTCILSS